MFWVDKIVDEIIEKGYSKSETIIRDEKTLSGSVHIGSLRGVVIHGVIAQVLNQRGRKARFLFEYNDYDPMDGLSEDLKAKGFEKYMGMPLCNIPSPDGKAKNFAEYYGDEFLKVIKKIGFNPELPRASETYKKGDLNGWITMALLKNKEIREIYKRVSGSEKPEHWSPVQVICEKCGKVGTTDVSSFNGSKVKYVCKKDKVEWAEGCENSGEISPFDGNAELTWKVEWPAKWDIYSVHVEGSGKDHNAAGGSHEIGEAICKEVAETTVPFNVPYEFFLFGGKKMSSSKGIGQTAADVADMLPPEMLRFLMLHNYNQAIDFDPEGETIPRLFDHYDEAAKWYFYEGEKDTVQTDLARWFELSQLSDEKPAQRVLPRFSQLVFVIQIPRLNVYEEMEKVKGEPLTAEDKKHLDIRIEYAKKWLSSFAPDHYRYTLQESLPDMAWELSLVQKEFLEKLADELEKMSDWEGEKVHGLIHQLIKSNDGYNPKPCFAAIYILFLAKDFGPQAGWFLSALEKQWVIKRLKEGASTEKKEEPTKAAPVSMPRVEDKHFRLSEAARERFPEIQIAYTIIRGLKIEKDSAKLEHLKKEMTPTPQKAAELLVKAEVLKQYKDIYRKMGVDPTKRKPTAIALLDRIAKGNELYSINPVVDILNLLTLQNGISFGAFDMNHFQLPVTFDFSIEKDEFLPIGEALPKLLTPGELCMFDAQGIALNRDYNYRDSDITKIRGNTKDILITLDSLDPLPLEIAKKELEKAFVMIHGVCGGIVETMVTV